MIDNENRSFFLNELDGFENNTGLVVLATTNHADRLDPALLNRPSRFDRKYYFNLPGVEERRAYVRAWNASGDGNGRVTDGDETRCEVRTGNNIVPVAIDAGRHSALRLSEEAIEEVVHQTADFSFAYLKELFLSTTMQWISTRAVALDSVQGVAPAAEFSMDEIIRDQVALLRSQLTAAASASSTLPTCGKLGRAIASVRNLIRS